MSVQTLYTAATGMDALETKLDVIANNMANINTTGFKKDRANFEDLFYRQIRLPGAQDADGNLTPDRHRSRPWLRASRARRPTSARAPSRRPNNPLDLAIEGDGFFQVTDPQRRLPATRGPATSSINANDQLVLGSAQTGRVLEPRSPFRRKPTDVVITPDGQVQYSTAGSPTLNNAGQIQLATFINPDGLLKLGDNLYQATDASGQPLTEQPRAQRRRRDSARASWKPRTSSRCRS